MVPTRGDVDTDFEATGPGHKERWGGGGVWASHHVPHRSLLSSVHFLLLVLLKVPLFLGMLSAVLWVNRPQ